MTRELTEEEKDREYREHNRVEGGTKVQGEAAEDLDEKGAAGEVRERREKEGK